MINSNSKEIQFIEFSELKEKLSWSINPLPDLTTQVLKNLREQIVDDGCLISAINIYKSFTDPNSYELADGFSRYSLLSSIIKENSSFNTLIPIIVKQFETKKEVKLFAIRNQLARRNLDASDIALAVKELTEAGKSKNQAVEEVALITGKSRSSVYRASNHELAQKERDRQQDNRIKKLEVETSNKAVNVLLQIGTVDKAVNIDTPAHEDANADTPQPVIKQRINNVEILEDRTKEDLKEIEDRYTYGVNERGETVITYTAPSAFILKECDEVSLSLKERLEFLNEEFVKGLKSNLDMVEENPHIHNLISEFVNSFSKYL